MQTLDIYQLNREAEAILGAHILMTRAHPAYAHITQFLEKTKTPQDVIAWLKRYGDWSEFFDGAIAGLISRLLTFNQKRKMEGAVTNSLQEDPLFVSACFVHDALKDEFGRGFAIYNHRALFRATLSECINYFQLSKDPAAAYLQAHPRREKVFQGIMKGYGHDSPLDVTTLLENVIFQLFSEAYALSEFLAMNDFLMVQYPALLEHLKNTKASIGQQDLPALKWLVDHAVTEEVHARSARGAVSILFTLVEQEQGRPRALRCIKDVLESFGKLEAEYFSY